jgi:hypothetical protein
MTGRKRSVAAFPAVAAHLSDYGAGRSTQSPRDGRDGLSLREASADFLALSGSEPPVLRCRSHTDILLLSVALNS